MKIRVLLPVICLLMSCSTPDGREDKNTITNVNRTPAETSAAADITPSPKRADPDREIRKDPDFEGTIGVVDKKNDIREVAVLGDVRTGRHEGFDRIVFEFKGGELPSYHIEYIDKPVRSCGSGDVVPLAGDAWLQVRFSTAAAHTEEGRPTVGFRQLSPRLPVVLELKSTCDFEAEVEWVAGVSSPNRYRVLELTGPTRLVIDVKHRLIGV